MSSVRHFMNDLVYKTSVGSSYLSYHDVENEIYHPHWLSFYALVKLSELFMSFAKCLSTLNSLRSVQFFRSGFWRISYSKPTKDVFPLPIFIGKYVQNLFPRKQVFNFLNFNFVKHIRNDMHIFLNFKSFINWFSCIMEDIELRLERNVSIYLQQIWKKVFVIVQSK